MSNYELPHYIRFSGVRYFSERGEIEVMLMNILTSEEIGIFYTDLPECMKKECDEYMNKFRITAK